MVAKFKATMIRQQRIPELGAPFNAETSTGEQCRTQPAWWKVFQSMAGQEVGHRPVIRHEQRRDSSNLLGGITHVFRVSHDNGEAPESICFRFPEGSSTASHHPKDECGDVIRPNNVPRIAHGTPTGDDVHNRGRNVSPREERVVWPSRPWISLQCCSYSADVALSIGQCLRHRILETGAELCVVCPSSNHLLIRASNSKQSPPETGSQSWVWAPSEAERLHSVHIKSLHSSLEDTGDACTDAKVQWNLLAARDGWTTCVHPFDGATGSLGNRACGPLRQDERRHRFRQPLHCEGRRHRVLAGKLSPEVRQSIPAVLPGDLGNIRKLASFLVLDIEQLQLDAQPCLCEITRRTCFVRRWRIGGTLNWSVWNVFNRALVSYPSRGRALRKIQNSGFLFVVLNYIFVWGTAVTNWHGAPERI
mmetsp:Transcript_2437/g.7120  ORF Transcript_2437/g.7120 Transcript_2437/m.7120 type:complete len:420 (-) Transcript_2437:1054-2313(-)